MKVQGRSPRAMQGRSQWLVCALMVCYCVAAPPQILVADVGNRSVFPGAAARIEGLRVQAEEPWSKESHVGVLVVAAHGGLQIRCQAWKSVAAVPPLTSLSELLDASSWLTTIHFRGRLDRLNSALACLYYQPPTTFLGGDLLTVSLPEYGEVEAKNVSLQVMEAARTFTMTWHSHIFVDDILEDTGLLAIGQQLSFSFKAAPFRTFTLRVEITMNKSHPKVFPGLDGPGVSAALESFTYDLPENFHGTITFHFTVLDEASTFSETFSSLLRIQPVNDAPKIFLDATEIGNITAGQTVQIGRRARIIVSDVDDIEVASELITTKIISNHGTSFLDTEKFKGVRVKSAHLTNTSHELALTGTVGNVNELLEGLQFRAQLAFSGRALLRFSAEDSHGAFSEIHQLYLSIRRDCGHLLFNRSRAPFTVHQNESDAEFFFDQLDLGISPGEGIESQINLRIKVGGRSCAIIEPIAGTSLPYWLTSNGLGTSSVMLSGSRDVILSTLPLLRLSSKNHWGEIAHRVPVFLQLNADAECTESFQIGDFFVFELLITRFPSPVKLNTNFETKEPLKVFSDGSWTTIPFNATHESSEPGSYWFSLESSSECLSFNFERMTNSNLGRHGLFLSEERGNGLLSFRLTANSKTKLGSELRKLRIRATASCCVGLEVEVKARAGFHRKGTESEEIAFNISVVALNQLAEIVTAPDPLKLKTGEPLELSSSVVSIVGNESEGSWILWLQTKDGKLCISAASFRGVSIVQEPEGNSLIFRAAFLENLRQVLRLVKFLPLKFARKVAAIEIELSHSNQQVPQIVSSAQIGIRFDDELAKFRLALNQSVPGTTEAILAGGNVEIGWTVLHGMRSIVVESDESVESILMSMRISACMNCFFFLERNAPLHFGRDEAEVIGTASDLQSALRLELLKVAKLWLETPPPSKGIVFEALISAASSENEDDMTTLEISFADLSLDKPSPAALELRLPKSQIYVRLSSKAKALPDVQIIGSISQKEVLTLKVEAETGFLSMGTEYSVKEVSPTGIEVTDTLDRLKEVLAKNVVLFHPPLEGIGSSMVRYSLSANALKEKVGIGLKVVLLGPDSNMDDFDDSGLSISAHSDEGLCEAYGFESLNIIGVSLESYCRLTMQIIAGDGNFKLPPLQKVAIRSNETEQIIFEGGVGFLNEVLAGTSFSCADFADVQIIAGPCGRRDEPREVSIHLRLFSSASRRAKLPYLELERSHDGIPRFQSFTRFTLMDAFFLRARVRDLEDEMKSFQIAVTITGPGRFEVPQPSEKKDLTLHLTKDMLDSTLSNIIFKFLPNEADLGPGSMEFVEFRLIVDEEETSKARLPIWHQSSSRVLRLDGPEIVFDRSCDAKAVKPFKSLILHHEGPETLFKLKLEAVGGVLSYEDFLVANESLYFPDRATLSSALEKMVFTFDQGIAIAEIEVRVEMVHDQFESTKKLIVERKASYGRINFEWDNDSIFLPSSGEMQILGLGMKIEEPLSPRLRLVVSITHGTLSLVEGNLTDELACEETKPASSAILCRGFPWRIQEFLESGAFRVLAPPDFSGLDQIKISAFAEVTGKQSSLLGEVTFPVVISPNSPAASVSLELPESVDQGTFLSEVLTSQPHSEKLHIPATISLKKFRHGLSSSERFEVSLSSEPEGLGFWDFTGALHLKSDLSNGRGETLRFYVSKMQLDTLQQEGTLAFHLRTPIMDSTAFRLKAVARIATEFNAQVNSVAEREVYLHVPEPAKRSSGLHLKAGTPCFLMKIDQNSRSFSLSELKIELLWTPLLEETKNLLKIRLAVSDCGEVWKVEDDDDKPFDFQIFGPQAAEFLLSSRSELLQAMQSLEIRVEPSCATIINISAGYHRTPSDTWASFSCTLPRFSTSLPSNDLQFVADGNPSIMPFPSDARQLSLSEDFLVRESGFHRGTLKVSLSATALQIHFSRIRASAFSVLTNSSSRHSVDFESPYVSDLNEVLRTLSISRSVSNWSGLGEIIGVLDDGRGVRFERVILIDVKAMALTFWDEGLSSVGYFYSSGSLGFEMTEEKRHLRLNGFQISSKANSSQRVSLRLHSRSPHSFSLWSKNNSPSICASFHDKVVALAEPNYDSDGSGMREGQVVSTLIDERLGEIHQISIVDTTSASTFSGTFRLSFMGHTSDTIPHNASALDLWGVVRLLTANSTITVTRMNSTNSLAAESYSWQITFQERLESLSEFVVVDASFNSPNIAAFAEVLQRPASIGGRFRLGIFGRWTGWLPFDARASAIQESFKFALPDLFGENGNLFNISDFGDTVDPAGTKAWLFEFSHPGRFPNILLDPSLLTGEGAALKLNRNSESSEFPWAVFELCGTRCAWIPSWFPTGSIRRILNGAMVPRSSEFFSSGFPESNHSGNGFLLSFPNLSSLSLKHSNSETGHSFRRVCQELVVSGFLGPNFDNDLQNVFLSSEDEDANGMQVIELSLTDSFGNFLAEGELHVDVINMLPSRTRSYFDMFERTVMLDFMSPGKLIFGHSGAILQFLDEEIMDLEIQTRNGFIRLPAAEITAAVIEGQNALCATMDCFRLQEKHEASAIKLRGSAMDLNSAISKLIYFGALFHSNFWQARPQAYLLKILPASDSETYFVRISARGVVAGSFSLEIVVQSLNEEGQLKNISQESSLPLGPTSSAVDLETALKSIAIWPSGVSVHVRERKIFAGESGASWEVLVLHSPGHSARVSSIKVSSQTLTSSAENDIPLASIKHRFTAGDASLIECNISGKISSFDPTANLEAVQRAFNGTASVQRMEQQTGFVLSHPSRGGRFSEPPRCEMEFGSTQIAVELLDAGIPIMRDTVTLKLSNAHEESVMDSSVFHIEFRIAQAMSYPLERLPLKVLVIHKLAKSEENLISNFRVHVVRNSFDWESHGERIACYVHAQHGLSFFMSNGKSSFVATTAREASETVSLVRIDFTHSNPSPLVDRVTLKCEFVGHDWTRVEVTQDVPLKVVGSFSKLLPVHAVAVDIIEGQLEVMESSIIHLNSGVLSLTTTPSDSKIELTIRSTFGILNAPPSDARVSQVSSREISIVGNAEEILETLAHVSYSPLHLQGFSGRDTLEVDVPFQVQKVIFVTIVRRTEQQQLLSLPLTLELLAEEDNATPLGENILIAGNLEMICNDSFGVTLLIRVLKGKVGDEFHQPQTFLESAGIVSKELLQISLDALIYYPPPGFFGRDLVSISVRCTNGHNGTSIEIPVRVERVVDPLVIAVNVPEGRKYSFDEPLFQVEDADCYPDVACSNLNATVTSEIGLLRVSVLRGLAVLQGTDEPRQHWALSGNVKFLNDALASLKYLPSPNVDGEDLISLEVKRDGQAEVFESNVRIKLHPELHDLVPSLSRRRHFVAALYGDTICVGSFLLWEKKWFADSRMVQFHAKTTLGRFVVESYSHNVCQVHFHSDQSVSFQAPANLDHLERCTSVLHVSFEDSNFLNPPLRFGMHLKGDLQLFYGPDKTTFEDLKMIPLQLGVDVQETSLVRPNILVSGRSESALIAREDESWQVHLVSAVDSAFVDLSSDTYEIDLLVQGGKLHISTIGGIQLVKRSDRALSLRGKLLKLLEVFDGRGKLTFFSPRFEAESILRVVSRHVVTGAEETREFVVHRHPSPYSPSCQLASILHLRASESTRIIVGPNQREKPQLVRLVLNAVDEIENEYLMEHLAINVKAQVLKPEGFLLQIGKDSVPNRKLTFSCSKLSHCVSTLEEEVFVVYQSRFAKTGSVKLEISISPLEEEQMGSSCPSKTPEILERTLAFPQFEENSAGADSIVPNFRIEILKSDFSFETGSLKISDILVILVLPGLASEHDGISLAISFSEGYILKDSLCPGIRVHGLGTSHVEISTLNSVELLSNCLKSLHWSNQNAQAFFSASLSIDDAVIVETGIEEILKGVSEKAIASFALIGSKEVHLSWREDQEDNCRHLEGFEGISFSNDMDLIELDVRTRSMNSNAYLMNETGANMNGIHVINRGALVAALFSEDGGLCLKFSRSWCGLEHILFTEKQSGHVEVLTVNVDCPSRNKLPAWVSKTTDIVHGREDEPIGLDENSVQVKDIAFMFLHDCLLQNDMVDVVLGPTIWTIFSEEELLRRNPGVVLSRLSNSFLVFSGCSRDLNVLLKEMQLLPPPEFSGMEVLPISLARHGSSVTDAIEVHFSIEAVDDMPRILLDELEEETWTFNHVGESLSLEGVVLDDIDDTFERNYLLEIRCKKGHVQMLTSREESTSALHFKGNLEMLNALMKRTIYVSSVGSLNGDTLTISILEGGDGRKVERSISIRSVSLNAQVYVGIEALHSSLATSGEEIQLKNAFRAFGEPEDRPEAMISLHLEANSSSAVPEVQRISVESGFAFDVYIIKLSANQSSASAAASFVLEFDGIRTANIDRDAVDAVSREIGQLPGSSVQARIWNVAQAHPSLEKISVLRTKFGEHGWTWTVTFFYRTVSEDAPDFPLLKVVSKTDPNSAIDVSVDLVEQNFGEPVFQLTFAGRSTSSIPFSSDGRAIRSALEGLDIVELVHVNRVESRDPRVAIWDVTFVRPGGDVPLMHASMVAQGNHDKISVREILPGLGLCHVHRIRTHVIPRNPIIAIRTISKGGPISGNFRLQLNLTSLGGKSAESELISFNALPKASMESIGPSAGESLESKLNSVLKTASEGLEKNYRLKGSIRVEVSRTASICEYACKKASNSYKAPVCFTNYQCDVCVGECSGAGFARRCLSDSDCDNMSEVCEFNHGECFSSGKSCSLSETCAGSGLCEERNCIDDPNGGFVWFVELVNAPHDLPLFTVAKNNLYSSGGARVITDVIEAREFSPSFIQLANSVSGFILVNGKLASATRSAVFDLPPCAFVVASLPTAWEEMEWFVVNACAKSEGFQMQVEGSNLAGFGVSLDSRPWKSSQEDNNLHDQVLTLKMSKFGLNQIWTGSTSSELTIFASLKEVKGLLSSNAGLSLARSSSNWHGRCILTATISPLGEVGQGASARLEIGFAPIEDAFMFRLKNKFTHIFNKVRSKLLSSNSFELKGRADTLIDMIIQTARGQVFLHNSKHVDMFRGTITEVREALKSLEVLADGKDLFEVQIAMKLSFGNFSVTRTMRVELIPSQRLPLRWETSPRAFIRCKNWKKTFPVLSGAQVASRFHNEDIGWTISVLEGTLALDGRQIPVIEGSASPFSVRIRSAEDGKRIEFEGSGSELNAIVPAALRYRPSGRPGTDSCLVELWTKDAPFRSTSFVISVETLGIRFAANELISVLSKQDTHHVFEHDAVTLNDVFSLKERKPLSEGLLWNQTVFTVTTRAIYIGMEQIVRVTGDKGTGILRGTFRLLIDLTAFGGKLAETDPIAHNAVSAKDEEFRSFAKGSGIGESMESKLLGAIRRALAGSVWENKMETLGLDVSRTSTVCTHTCVNIQGPTALDLSCSDDSQCDICVGSCAGGSPISECLEDSDCGSGTCSFVSGICISSGSTCTTDFDCARSGSCAAKDCVMDPVAGFVWTISFKNAPSTFPHFEVSKNDLHGPTNPLVVLDYSTDRVLEPPLKRNANQIQGDFEFANLTFPYNVSAQEMQQRLSFIFPVVRVERGSLPDLQGGFSWTIEIESTEPIPLDGFERAAKNHRLNGVGASISVSRQFRYAPISFNLSVSVSNGYLRGFGDVFDVTSVTVTAAQRHLEDLLLIPLHQSSFAEVSLKIDESVVAKALLQFASARQVPPYFIGEFQRKISSRDWHPVGDTIELHGTDGIFIMDLVVTFGSLAFDSAKEIIRLDSGDNTRKICITGTSAMLNWALKNLLYSACNDCKAYTQDFLEIFIEDANSGEAAASFSVALNYSFHELTPSLAFAQKVFTGDREVTSIPMTGIRIQDCVGACGVEIEASGIGMLGVSGPVPDLDVTWNRTTHRLVVGVADEDLINLVLERLVYIPNEHFNTKGREPERIVFKIFPSAGFDEEVFVHIESLPSKPVLNVASIGLDEDESVRLWNVSLKLYDGNLEVVQLSFGCSSCALRLDNAVKHGIEVMSGDPPSALKLRGVSERVSRAIASGDVIYTPLPNWHGSDSVLVEVIVGDGAVHSSAAFTVEVNALNDVPEWHIPSSDEFQFREDSATALVGVQLSDPDVNSLDTLSVEISALLGTVRVGTEAPLPRVNFNGTLHEITAVLRNLNYQPPAGLNFEDPVLDRVTFWARDAQGLAATSELAITGIIPRADRPVISIPWATMVNEDSCVQRKQRSLPSGAENESEFKTCGSIVDIAPLFVREDEWLLISGVQMLDIDSKVTNGHLLVRISCIHGKVKFPQASKVRELTKEFLETRGGGAVSFSCTLVRCNLVLQTIQYRGAENWFGSDLLSIHVINSSGETTKQDIPIVVLPETDIPYFTKPFGGAVVTQEDVSVFLFDGSVEIFDDDSSEKEISLFASAKNGFVQFDFSFVPDLFVIPAFANDETVLAISGTAFHLNRALPALRYVPNANWNGADKVVFAVCNPSAYSLMNASGSEEKLIQGVTFAEFSSLTFHVLVAPIHDAIVLRFRLGYDMNEWKIDGTRTATLHGLDIESSDESVFLDVKAYALDGMVFAAEDIPGVIAEPIAGGLRFYGGFRAMRDLFRGDLLRYDAEGVWSGTTQIYFEIETEDGIWSNCSWSLEVPTQDKPQQLAIVRQVAWNDFFEMKLLGTKVVRPSHDFANWGIFVVVASITAPKELTEINSKIVFSAWSEGAGLELWISDFTELGTQLLWDLMPGPESSFPTGFHFHTDDGNIYFAASGKDLSWMQQDLDECSGFLNAYGDIWLAVADSNVFDPFAGYECPVGFSWATSSQLSGSIGSPAIDLQTLRNSKSYYAHRCGWKGNLWRGFAKTHFMVRDGHLTGLLLDSRQQVGDEPRISWPLPSSDFAGIVCIPTGTETAADDRGRELWRTDGTEAGTFRVADVLPGSGGSRPAHFTSFQAKLYFAAWADGHGRELWASDGTAAGTTLAQDVLKGIGSSDPMHLTSSADGTLMFFSAFSPESGRELWVSDGTISFGRAEPVPRRNNVVEEGTQLVADIMPGTGLGSEPSELVALFDSYIAFVADDDVHGTQIWISDGTSMGTGRLTNIGSRGCSPRGLIVFDGRLYFTADDGVHGRELWRVGGISLSFAATRQDLSEFFIGPGPAVSEQLVEDILPGAKGSNPKGLATFTPSEAHEAAFANIPLLIFEANQRLWFHDGITTRKSLSRTFSDFSLRTSFVTLNDRVYFGAYT